MGDNPPDWCNSMADFQCACGNRKRELPTNKNAEVSPLYLLRCDHCTKKQEERQRLRGWNLD